MNMTSKNQDILLLASTCTEAQSLKSILLDAYPELEEGRIVAEHDCLRALQAVNQPNFKVKIISPEANADCLTKNIYNLIISKSTEKSFKIILEDSFPIEIDPRKLFVFDYKTRNLKVRKKDFQQNKNFVRSLFRTLLDIPPVYISYGSEKGETDFLIRTIADKARLVLPHVKFKYDKKDVKFRKSIEQYIKELKHAQNIILILNRKYLTSKYCMDEFIGILKASATDSELNDKIYPLVLESANCIYNPAKLVEINDYWQKEQKQVIESMIHHQDRSLDNELVLINEIINTIPILADKIIKFYTLPLETHMDSNFYELLWEINSQFSNGGFLSFYSETEEMIKILTE